MHKRLVSEGSSSVRNKILQTIGAPLLAISLVVIGCSAPAHMAFESPPAAVRPSHIILIIIDGGRYDNIEMAETPKIDFLMEKGAVGYAVSVLPAVTWPGHAAILTGAHPDASGIVGNTYYDRESRKHLGLDPKGWGEFLEAETIFDVAAWYGLKTAVASSLWWLSKAPNVDVGIDPKSDVKDVPDYLSGFPVDERRLNPAFPAPGDFGFETSEQFMPAETWATDAAMLILERERPKLLVMNFKMTDLVGHAVGPMLDTRGDYSCEVVEVLEHVDTQIGRLLDKLKELGMMEQTTIIITADHGMVWYDSIVDPAEIFPPAIEVSYFTWGTGCHIYLENPDEDLMAAVEVLRAHPAVDEVVYGTGLARLRLDHTRSGDIFISVREGYCITGGDWKGRGMHGANTPGDRLVPLIMTGPGIEAGVDLGVVSQLDIAPTITRLLGIPSPAQAEGRVLSEALLPIHRPVEQ